MVKTSIVRRIARFSGKSEPSSEVGTTWVTDEGELMISLDGGGPWADGMIYVVDLNKNRASSAFRAAVHQASGGL